MSPPTKHVFLVRSGGPRAPFVERFLHEVAPELVPHARGTVKLGYTERDNPRLTVLPLRRENVAMVSAWGPIDVDDFAEVLARLGGLLTGYRVRESYPLRYERSWPDGETSPGDVLLTLLVKHRALDDAAFLEEWHGRHTPKALRIHPMWSYARNVVEADVFGTRPAFDGIVEEHYRELRDILNPVRMFGGPSRFLPHMLEVARHVGHFLDLRATENYLLRERYLLTRDDAA